MKNRFAGITAAVMAAAMMMTFPVQAFAGTYGSGRSVGYVTPCTTSAPADIYVTASSPAAYAPAPYAPAAPAAPAARQGQYEAVRMEINGAEEQTAALNRRMQAAQTQTELNELAGQKFQVWDNELNSVWKRLENTLSKDAMERLRAEERTWISQKEKVMQQEAAAFGGGSMASMAYAEKGTELTRARVYVLAEYLK